MCTTNRIALALSLVALLASGCGRPHDWISVYDRPSLEVPTSPDLTGCTGSDDSVDGSTPFVVGSRVTIYFDRERECTESSFWHGCTAFGPGPRSISLRSTNTDVLRDVGDSEWEFVGPGEATLILTVEGQDTMSRTFRAEQAAFLDARILAQPAMDAGDGTDRVMEAATLVPAEGAALLRAGAGAGMLIRALGANGQVLCGHPALTVTSSAGMEAYDAFDVPTIGSPFTIATTTEAASVAHVHLDAVGLSGGFDVDVIDPSELTTLDVRELPSRDAGSLDHTYEVMPRAGEREVYGASITATTSELDDCTDVSVYFPRDGSPNNTRFRAESYCGNDAEPTFQVAVVGAPSIGADIVVHAL
jgi:hypothetical protein